MSRIEFEIERGRLGLAVVDTTVVGYSDDWQAPGGAVLPTVTIADYNANSSMWSCQIVGGQFVSTPDTTTRDVAATWCEPGETVPAPKKSSYEFSGSFLQDANSKDGLNAFLFEFDADEAYLYAGYDGDNPPRLIGRVRLASGSIGGEARSTLTSDFSFPLVRKPDAEFGTAGNSRIILGAAGAPATGATAGIPGTWTPTGSTPPASVAALASATPNVVVASPTTAWTTGQYVQTATSGTGGRAHWNGTAWVAGAA